MSDREPVGWITVSGKHVPIYDGESSKDAYNRFVAKHNEDTKEKQIAKNKEQADKRNKSNGWHSATKPTEKQKSLNKKVQKVVDKKKSSHSKSEYTTWGKKYDDMTDEERKKVEQAIRADKQRYR